MSVDSLIVEIHKLLVRLSVAREEKSALVDQIENLLLELLEVAGVVQLYDCYEEVYNYYDHYRHTKIYIDEVYQLLLEVNYQEIVKR